MSGQPAFTIRMPEPYTEPTPRWIRVRAGDEWVADSRRALLVCRYGPGTLPTYAFPDEDVADPALAHRLEGLPPQLAAAEGMWSFDWGGEAR